MLFIFQSSSILPTAWALLWMEITVWNSKVWLWDLTFTLSLLLRIRIQAAVSLFYSISINCLLTNSTPSSSSTLAILQNWMWCSSIDIDQWRESLRERSFVQKVIGNLQTSWVSLIQVSGLRRREYSLSRNRLLLCAKINRTVFNLTRLNSRERVHDLNSGSRWRGLLKRRGNEVKI